MARKADWPWNGFGLIPTCLGVTPNIGVTMALPGNNLFHHVFSRPQDLILGPFSWCDYVNHASSAYGAPP